MYTENKTIPLTDLGGGVVRKILSYSENLMAVELQFEKGAVGAKHSHPHEQMGYIVEGSLVYQEEGKEDKVLGTGDQLYPKNIFMLHTDSASLGRSLFCGLHNRDS